MGDEGLVGRSDMARRGREEKKGRCCQATVRPTTASLRIRRLGFTVKGYNSVQYGYSEQCTHIMLPFAVIPAFPPCSLS